MVRFGGVSSSFGLAMGVLARLRLTKYEPWLDHSPDLPQKLTKKIRWGINTTLMRSLLCFSALKLPFVVYRGWTQDEFSHHSYCSTCFVDHVRYWVSGRTYDTATKNESLYATWRWDLWFFVENFHQNDTNKWIVIENLIQSETKIALKVFKTRVIEDNGEKELNMKQSTLDFWSEFNFKVKR